MATMKLAEAQAAYDEAVRRFAAVEARIDAVEQFADRAAEERADAAYAKAEAALADAVDDLHAAGGRTNEEIAASAPPSERFGIRSQGDRFGLGESWEIFVRATGEHVSAWGSEAKAQAALAQSDERWNRKRAIAARRRA